VLAGNPLPVMCKTVVWNDGVVPVESALWRIKDNALSKNVHTELTGTADFSNFVKPRLAIGPKGDHNPEQPDSSQLPNQTGRREADSFAPMFAQASVAPMFVKASFSPQTQTRGSAPAAEEFRPSFTKEVKLAPKQVLEIELPVSAAPDFGITFMADAKVAATLTDAAGAVRGRNAADSLEARGFFRTIFVDKGVTAGTWKLKIENTGTFEAVAVIAAWNNALKR
jgi:hypothetical protein